VSGSAWLWVSVAAAAVLLVVTMVTARAPHAPVPDEDGYFERWSDLHGGYEPRGTVFTGRWLRLVYVLARPLARAGVQPDVLTAWGAVTSLLVVALVQVGDRWVLLAVAVVVLSGLLDNLDGAVAVLSGRTSRFGYVWDSVVDRVSDVLYVTALVVLGAPLEVAAVGAGLMMLQEFTRARAGNAGMGEIGVVTVWERPTRVVVTAVLLLLAGLFPGQSESIATAGAWAWIGLGLVGFTQLVVVVHRRLTAGTDG
jgi:CDP-diacylglycerol--glycerol-3-phosphate 3-phosphatidyltransferase